jgi:hypothetical protein
MSTRQIRALLLKGADTQIKDENGHYSADFLEDFD